MAEPKRKKYILIGIGLLLILAMVYGFMPQKQQVETATVNRAPLQVIVEEEGETQVSHKYVIYSPNMAYARRIDLEPGDKVQEGQALVQLESPRSAILDARTRAEAGSRIEAARATLAQANENVQIATSAAEQAATERTRIVRLFENGSATEQQRDQVITEDVRAQAGLKAAIAAKEAAEANLKTAQAAFRNSDDTVREVLSAPVSGRVLAVLHESAGPVSPGAPLLEIGDINGLEISVDVLSQDAVRITPGTRVLIEQWGGDKTLEAVVNRVDPQGFTRISSLGVEEKRVNVVATIHTPQAEWQGLGAGYRVLARFVVWEDASVLQVPTSALFRAPDTSEWAVFVIEAGEAQMRSVEVGHQGGLFAQVLSGLSEGERVITHPASTLEAGMSVEPRDDT